MIENTLNYREILRIENWYREGKGIDWIAARCIDDGREDHAPCRQAVRAYLDRCGLWKVNTPRTPPAE